jgi:hypothetical protein
MNCVYPAIEIMIARMKPLPPRHRIAHLCALIGRQPAGSVRRGELVALLRVECTARPANENRSR